MNKCLVFLLFCVTFLSLTQGASPAANTIWGTRQLGDERLLYKIVKQKSGWFFTKSVEDVDYPGTGAFSTANITYIEAINQKPTSGSSVTIIKGGVGLPFVKLHFKSSRTDGFDYILQIYGKLNPVHAVQPQPAYPPPNGYPVYPPNQVPVGYPQNFPVRHY